MYVYVSLFFFRAEDGIRDADVTGVQTCALPISWARRLRWVNPTTLVSRTDRAPARAMTRGSPKRNAPVRHPASPDGCATRAKAGLARTQPGPARSVSNSRRVAP